MKAEFGRSFMWFLEERSEASYRQHHQDEVESAKHLAWRCLKGIVVDKRLFPEANQYPQLFEGFNAKTPNAHHYAEITGKVQWLKHIDGVDYLTLVPEDAPAMTILIPLTAIVSVRSTGFPKVAYNVEQYIMGYAYILEVLTKGWQDVTSVVQALQPLMHPKNFSTAVFDAINKIMDGLKQGQFITAPTIQALEALMIDDMLASIPEQCKGMYHHALEWNVSPSVFEQDSLLMQAYLKMRKKYPNMVPGRAFIPVKKL